MTDEAAKLNTQELIAISLTILSIGLDTITSCCNEALLYLHSVQTFNRKLGKSWQKSAPLISHYVMRWMIRNVLALFALFMNV